MLFCRERRARGDRGAATEFRFDGEVPHYQLHSLPHADEAEAATVHRVLRVETNSQVAHSQFNLCLGTVQFHFEMPHATVFHCILQSFL